MRDKPEAHKPYRVRLDGKLFEIMWDRNATVYRVKLNQRVKVRDPKLVTRVQMEMAKREGAGTIVKALRMIWAALKTPWL